MRQQLINRVRRHIADGTYETADKLAIVTGRLIGVICPAVICPVKVQAVPAILPATDHHDRDPERWDGMG